MLHVLRVYGLCSRCTPSIWIWFPLYSEYMDLVPVVLPSIWIWFPRYSEYMDLIPAVLRVYGFGSRGTPGIWI